jgi:peptidyl-prolyl cis-trans isomerase A (cyclophilin A)
MKTIWIGIIAGIGTFGPALALADSSAGDPLPTHMMTLEDAVKGIKGAGTLMVKIEIEHTGKPLGTFTCELYDKQSPKTVANFVGLARGLRPFKDKSGEWVKKPLYDGLVFHRVITDFMIQGGDPDGTGRGGPGYEFEDETTNGLKLDKGGMLAMANKGPGTNGSQFFITEKPTDWLTGKHTVFGACEPVDLVTKIAGVPKGAGDRPNDPVTIKKVTILRGTAKKAKAKAK